MLKNTWKFTKTVVLGDEFTEATGNRYMVVSQAPFLDKNGKIGIQGTTLSLMVLEDSTDYGVDRSTGEPRDTNKFETFDVTILNGETHLPIIKGDYISLEGFDLEHSYAMNYSLVMRFLDYKKIDKES